MDNLKYIPFVVQFSAFMILIDSYFIYSWSRFVRENNWNKMLYRSMWAVAGLMIVISAYTAWIQIVNHIPTNFEKSLFAFKSIWYLPKIVIVPFLLIYDAAMLLKSVIFGSRRHQQPGATRLRNSTPLPAQEIQQPLQLKPQRKPQLQLQFQTSQSPLSEKIPEIKPDSMSPKKSSSPEDRKKKFESRRKFIKRAGWAATTVPFLIVTNGVLDTTYDTRVHEVDVPIAKLPDALDGLHIVQLSDVHAGSFHSSDPMNRAAEIVNTLKPDLLVFTGDFVNYNHDEYKTIGGAIRKMKADIGAYGCLGNHDHYMYKRELNKLRNLISASGIQLLDNENRIFEINNTRLQLAGMDNSGYGQNFGDLAKTMSGLEYNIPTILLSHDPNNWEESVKKKLPVDLMLSGHTHGGQAGFRIFGHLVTPARFIYKHWAGLYQENGQYLYVNRGYGTSGPPVRVGVNPEITSIKLRKKILS